MMDLSNPAILALVTAAIGEALKTWGSYALVLIVLGLMHWRSERRLKALEAENEGLRKEVTSLQEKRLEDAQKLIRVTEVGTATMASRGEGDQAIAAALSKFAEKLSDIEERFALPKPTRRPSR